MKTMVIYTFLLILLSCNKIDVPVFIEDEEPKQTLPISADGDTIYYRDGYTFSYSEKWEQPKWVFYTLKVSDIECSNGATRKNNFKVDAGVTTGSASLDDYIGSGYDRGHLKASADESCDQRQMDETFLMSNMSPQDPSFNRGIWKNLESHVRDLVYNYDSLQVVTGGNLVGNLNTIGVNKVGIPNYYYKVIYKYKNGVREVECYYLPNQKNNDYTDFITGIIELEDVVNIDFP